MPCCTVRLWLSISRRTIWSMRSSSGTARKMFRPILPNPLMPMDVREFDTEVVVEAELPGIAREDIAVRYHDGRLILEGQRKDVREAGDANGAAAWLRRERMAGRFHRSFDLPESVDSSAIRAETRDGVLRVVLPKLEKAQPRQIEVSVN